MEAILEQLGVDSSVFYLFAIFFLLILVLGPVYFKPFYKLLEMRRKRTVEDREAGDTLMKTAEAKFEQYQNRLAEQRYLNKQEMEKMLQDVRKEEADILNNARTNARKITQESLASLEREKTQLAQSLQGEAEVFAQQVTKTLLTAGGEK